LRCTTDTFDWNDGASIAGPCRGAIIRQTDPSSTFVANVTSINRGFDVGAANRLAWKAMPIATLYTSANPTILRCVLTAAPASE